MFCFYGPGTIHLIADCYQGDVWNPIVMLLIRDGDDIQ
jgi:hypothetical protein